MNIMYSPWNCVTLIYWPSFLNLLTLNLSVTSFNEWNYISSRTYNKAERTKQVFKIMANIYKIAAAVSSVVLVLLIILVTILLVTLRSPKINCNCFRVSVVVHYWKMHYYCKCITIFVKLMKCINILGSRSNAKMH